MSNRAHKRRQQKATTPPQPSGPGSNLPPMADPVLPALLRVGFRLPFYEGRTFLRRPFAWVPLGLASLIVFFPLIVLMTYMLEGVVFGGKLSMGDPLLLGFREVAMKLFGWVLLPIILVPWLAGARLFRAGLPLPGRLVAEPLRYKGLSSALLRLGAISTALAFAIYGLSSELLPKPYDTVAIIAATMLWRCTLWVTTVRLWEGDRRVLVSLWATIKAYRRTWKAWLGLMLGLSVLCVLVLVPLAVLVFVPLFYMLPPEVWTVGGGALLPSVNQPPTLFMVMGWILLPLMLLLTTWSFAFRARMAQVMHDMSFKQPESVAPIAPTPGL